MYCTFIAGYALSWVIRRIQPEIFLWKPYGMVFGMVTCAIQLSIQTSLLSLRLFEKFEKNDKTSTDEKLTH
jgi:hypothetical protein